MANRDESSGLSNVRVLGTATGMTATVIAWGVLVFTAIDYGRTARDGSGRDWIFLVAAAVGAIACMFAAIMLAARLQVMMRSVPPRSSTRPLPQPLADLPSVSDLSHASAVRMSSTAPQPPRVRNPTAGKRAARG